MLNSTFNQFKEFIQNWMLPVDSVKSSSESCTSCTSCAGEPHCIKHQAETKKNLVLRIMITHLQIPETLLHQGQLRHLPHNSCLDQGRTDLCDKKIYSTHTVSMAAVVIRLLDSRLHYSSLARSDCSQHTSPCW